MFENRRRIIGESLLTGAVVVAALSGYLIAIGYRVPTYHNGLLISPVLIFLFASFIVGVELRIGFHANLYITIAAAVLYLVLLPWSPLFGPGPDVGTLFDFSGDTLFLAVVLTLIASIEYVVRNQAIARSWFTPKATTWAGGVGVLSAILGLAIRTWAFGIPVGSHSPILAGFVLWMGLGGFLLGAVPTFLFVREFLLAPGVVVGGCFIYSVIVTWQSLQSIQQSGAAMDATSTTFTLLLVGWFVPLAVALLIGGLEYLLRARYLISPVNQ